MVPRILSLIPPAATKLAIALFLSFLIGLEREELNRDGRRTFGGVRTFPIIGLIGYAIAFIAHGQVLAIVAGFAVVAAFLCLSYWQKLRNPEVSGMTTEMSGLLVYLASVLVYLDYLWLAATIIVVCLLLLELKTTLENLSRRMASEDILTIAKFLVLTAVILPLVPNAEFGPFRVNPFKTWLVVLAVSGISYVSYLLQHAFKGSHGTFLTGIVGGAYSSTATTVALAKRAASGASPHAHAGGILAASGVMYVRILALVWIFNRGLGLKLAPWFAVLAVGAVLAGWGFSRREGTGEVQPASRSARNPLEIRAALFFAALFLVMVVATQVAAVHMGRSGMVTLAAFMGVADVDPFIMGLTQAGGVAASNLQLAALGVVICTATNNLAKAGYAWFFARSAPRTALWSFGLLAGLAVLGLLPVFWL